MQFQATLEFAIAQDAADPLREYRERFHMPVLGTPDLVYFTGHSLGLQPKTARAAVELELDEWAKYGVEGHFHSTNPWYSYHELLTPAMASIVGAKESEVVCMNSLTTNIHLLFVSFYTPTKQRYKIISEARMFPSDRYLLETQAKFHGFDPEDAIIEVAPRDGERLIREEDILAAITANADEVALVFFGGVNYFTGQLFNMPRLTKAAHAVGAKAGFDLAHAAGNVPLSLHDWDVDFAAWCSYKYLNSSPGNVGGDFRSRTSRPEFRSAEIRRLVGARQVHPLPDEKRFSADGGCRRLAAQQRAGARHVGDESVARYFRRSRHARLAREEREADRLPRVHGLAAG